MDPRPSFLQLLGNVTSLWRRCSDRLAGIEEDRAPVEAAVRRLERTTAAIAGRRPAAKARLAR